MNTQPAPLAPKPLMTYQGAYLPITGTGLSVGPFSVEQAPVEVVGIGYAIAHKELNQVPVTTVRTAAVTTHLEDKPTNVVQIGFDQNQTEWLMTFSVLTDPQGALIGADFALDVQSNYPGIQMSVARTPINQKGFNVLTKGVLPADYHAELVLQFWNNGKVDLPLDGWLAVQVAYAKVAPGQKASGAVGTPLVTTGELLFYPTPGGGNSPVLGNNYPRPNRHDEPRIVKL